MRVAAIGRTEILFESIRMIESSSHELDLIVTCDAEEFYQKDESDFGDLADELGVDFVETTDLNDRRVVSEIREREIDVAISVNWKTLIGPETLDSFTYGILNFHAGDLPRYRGNAAMNWAMIQGEDEIVYTIHRMAEKLDSGPIFTQRTMAITSDTYLFDAYDFAVENVPEMFLNVLDGLEDGSIEATPQPEDPKKALRCYPRRREDSLLKWNKPARYLQRLVRASAEPLDGAFTFYDDERLIVWRAHVEDPPTPYLGIPGQVAERRSSTGEVTVITGDRFLALEEVETPSSGRMSASDIIRSSRDRLG